MANGCKWHIENQDDSGTKYSEIGEGLRRAILRQLGVKPKDK